eukprot:COSAG01_NODE_3740_length_5746_cov_2.375421_9_plen_60_part_00
MMPPSASISKSPPLRSFTLIFMCAGVGAGQRGLRWSRGVAGEGAMEVLLAILLVGAIAR